MIKIYMVIHVIIHFLNQIFDDKNINSSVKGANYNQVCILENFKFVCLCQRVFCDKKN